MDTNFYRFAIVFDYNLPICIFLMQNQSISLKSKKKLKNKTKSAPKGYPFDRWRQARESWTLPETRTERIHLALHDYCPI